MVARHRNNEQQVHDPKCRKSGSDWRGLGTPVWRVDWSFQAALAGFSFRGASLTGA